MIITRAPLRISFLGGGSDFPAHFRSHGGAVLATAIDRFVYVTVAPLQDAFHGANYKLAYSKIEQVSSLEEIEHPAIRESIRLACPDRALELHHIADLPACTGLGSSSSFVVAMLKALYEFRKQSVPACRLAQEAIAIEREILEEAGGYQDQIMAALGGVSLVEFNGREPFSVNTLPLAPQRIREIEQHSLVLYTGVRRNSFEVLEGQQVRTANGQNTRLLSQLADLAREGADYLCSDQPIVEFGKLLDRAWRIKRQLADVSLPEVDRVYAEALRQGATGGKLLGAGRGGFLLLWAPPERHALLRSLAPNMVPLPVRIAAAGVTVLHAQRA